MFLDRVTAVLAVFGVLANLAMLFALLKVVRELVRLTAEVRSLSSVLSGKHWQHLLDAIEANLHERVEED